MPTYNVMPNLVPADDNIEADNPDDAIEEAIESALDLMRDRSNWTAAEVDGDADA